MEKQVNFPSLFSAQLLLLYGYEHLNPYLAMACLTNHGKVYTIRIYLSNFPDGARSGMGQMLKKQNRCRYGLSLRCDAHPLVALRPDSYLPLHGSAAGTPEYRSIKCISAAASARCMPSCISKTGKPLDYFLSHAM